MNLEGERGTDGRDIACGGSVISYKLENFSPEIKYVNSLCLVWKSFSCSSPVLDWMACARKREKG